MCPGFIDGHIHIESSMTSPGEFERAVVPHGTTAVITDPHEIANVAGTAGIRLDVYKRQAAERPRKRKVPLSLQLSKAISMTLERTS